MNAASRRPNTAPGRWVPAIAAAALLGTVVVAGVAGGSGGNGGADTSSSQVSVASVPAAPPVVTVPPTESAPVVTEPQVQTVPLTRTLGRGVVGDDVARVQQRLVDLGFNPGGVDGEYGSLTIQSIWAFEKLVMGVPRDQATGRVTPEMWERMQDPALRIEPRRPNPGTRNHTEIYLPEQVLAVFHAGVPVFVAHISSGDDAEWCKEVTISPGEQGNEDGEEPLKVGRCGRSVTPGGVFTYHRMVEGRRESALGGMLNPVYFNYGIAVHGAYEVPLRPASHGCVRIPNALSAEYQSLVARGERVFVWDGVKDPEEYGEQLPYFDRPDPDYSTTTTTTTTTVPETTAPEPTVPEPTAPETTPPTPPTTVPPTATTAPPTTTIPEESATTAPPVTEPPAP